MRYPLAKSLPILLSFEIVACGLVYAQTPPDAGALRQQIEKDMRPALPPRTPSPEPAERATTKLPEGQTVTVQAFRFAGNTLLDSAQLHTAVQDYIGRPLTFGELQQAAQAVASVYRAAGWIVRAYLPKQDITDGIVTIQIVEAVYSGVRLEGAEPTRLKLSKVLSLFNAQQKIGEPINVGALDRALLLADDLPGVAVAGALAAGRQEGETELVIKLSDEPLLFGDIGVDNSGSRSTGAERITLAASVNSPLRLGDRLRAYGLHSEGSDYFRLDYGLPIGADGWRAGINASRLDYRLVAPDFASLNGKGSSAAVGVEASYPLIRSRLHNLYLTVSYDDKRFRNEANAAIQSKYATGNWTLGLAGNLFDKFGGGGANGFALAWTDGRLRQGQLDSAENPNHAGHFTKLRYSLSRQQALTSEVSLFGNFSGQYADEDLDSSERFFLGGPSGVRAYPVNEGSGSRGQLVNLEVRGRLPKGFVLTGFYDWGHVANTGAGAGANYSLKGHGVALGWATPFGLDLKAVWARRDGANPNPTATGKDQDGSLERDRWWLNASLSF